ncbi:MAG: prenyltransferase [Burkholderiales bacterium]|nr:prenyltransferase [Burkholderiales bacterium]
MQVPNLFGPLRPPFLLLTPACVAVGVATAYAQLGHVDAWLALWVLLGALASHASVNAFNEYFDFRSGLDAITTRTPFSGGSGTLPANPALASATLAMAVLMLAVAALLGLYFVVLRGWALVPLGLAGLLLVVTYTTWWAHRPLACLVAPGLGLGLFVIAGTHFVLTGEWSRAAVAASVPVACLVSNLLLLNQFPDVEADRTVGRHNVAIDWGRPAAARTYATMMGFAYASLVAFVLLRWLPAMSLLATLTLPLAARAVRDVLRHPDNLPALVPAMRLNVLVNLLTPGLLAVGVATG